MPKVNGANVIALERNKFSRIGIIAALIVVVLGGLFIFDGQKNKNCDLKIENKCIKLEYSNSKAEREKGLSGHEKLPMDNAMLFTFQSPGKYCFWMKDMKFDLDIIWLDANKKVVAMEKDIKPSTYPDSICPEQPAQYVLEGTQGFVDLYHLTIGQQLHL